MKLNTLVILVALMAVGASAFLVRADDRKQPKVLLKLSQVPAAVQTVLKQEAAKHPLASLSRGDDTKAEVYEGKFRDGDQTTELKVAANGRVLSREMEKNHQEDVEEQDD